MQFIGVIATGLGAIAIGSNSAFLALAGSFIILSSVSYAIPFAANLATGRKNFPKGPFHLGKAGFAINALAVVFIIFFDTLFCFRKLNARSSHGRYRFADTTPAYVMPVTVELMNWNSVILVGVVALTAGWWLIDGKNYPGPKVMSMYIHPEASSTSTEGPVAKE